MISVKRGLRILATIIALVFPWSHAEALETFERFGMITATKIGSFTVTDQVYRIHPGVRFSTNDATRQQASDLEKGDLIVFSGNILSGTYLVDYIRYRTEEVN